MFVFSDVYNILNQIQHANRESGSSSGNSNGSNKTGGGNTNQINSIKLGGKDPLRGGKGTDKKCC